MASHVCAKEGGISRAKKAFKPRLGNT